MLRFIDAGTAGVSTIELDEGPIGTKYRR